MSIVHRLLSRDSNSKPAGGNEKPPPRDEKAKQPKPGKGNGKLPAATKQKQKKDTPAAGNKPSAKPGEAAGEEAKAAPAGKPGETRSELDKQLDAVEAMLDAQEREHEKLKKLMDELDSKLDSVAKVIAGDAGNGKSGNQPKGKS